MQELKIDITPEVSEALGHYVYKLIDPRDEKVFYIGRGQGDRVLSHIREHTDVEDKTVTDYVISSKLSVIRSIKKEGLSPRHVIVRHGMTASQASLVEAILIEETPGLTNLVSGKGTDQYGRATLEELISRYSSECLTLSLGLKVLVIKIKRSRDDDVSIDYDDSIYEAARKAWKISVARAKKADLIFAVTDDLVRGVFVADEWLPATTKNFPALLEDIPGRYGFNGRDATPESTKKYLGKRLPPILQGKGKRGMASPILYNYS